MTAEGVEGAGGEQYAVLAPVLADEIRMYGHAHGSWLPIHLARHLVKQMELAGWRVTPPVNDGPDELGSAAVNLATTWSDL